MSVGPVQLLVLGFDHPNFHGEVIEELERLKANDTIKVIDALAVHKVMSARSSAASHPPSRRARDPGRTRDRR